MADFSLKGRQMRNVRQMVSRVCRQGYVAQVRRLGDMPPRGDRAASSGRRTPGGAARPSAASPWRSAGSAVPATGTASSPRPPRTACCAALLHFVPWGSDGLSLDLMRRDRAAQPGVNDFLIVETIKAAPELGIKRLSLNFAVFRSALARGERIGAGPVLRAWRGSCCSPPGGSRSSPCTSSTPSSARTGCRGSSCSPEPRTRRGSPSPPWRPRRSWSGPPGGAPDRAQAGPHPAGPAAAAVPPGARGRGAPLNRPPRPRRGAARVCSCRRCPAAPAEPAARTGPARPPSRAASRRCSAPRVTSVTSGTPAGGRPGAARAAGMRRGPGPPGLPDPGRCLVMGVVNVTPDSFSDGGAWFGTDAAIAPRAANSPRQGADIVDVGGESTRPGRPADDGRGGTPPGDPGDHRAGRGRTCRSAWTPCGPRWPRPRWTPVPAWSTT